MIRVVLHHQGQEIALPVGDTIVGRALECRVRFNDPAVSRRHLRLLVRVGGVVAHNLSASNGTLVNGVRLRAPTTLADGDVIRIGYRTLRVELAEREPTSARAQQPVVLGRELAPGLYDDDADADADADAESDEATRPGALDAAGVPTTSSLAHSLADSMAHTCPRCRAQASYALDVCPRCGYVWPGGRPTSRTQEIEIVQVAVRAHPRFAVEVPVVYSSETLGIDALVRDLSRGGMFIASDLLDPTDTVCEVTALPDGHAAVVFAGIVAHVVNQASAGGGRPPGLGIRFTGMSDAARAWMDDVLGRLERPSGAPPDGDGEEPAITVDALPDDDDGGDFR